MVRQYVWSTTGIFRMDIEEPAGAQCQVSLQINNFDCDLRVALKAGQESGERERGPIARA